MANKSIIEKVVVLYLVAHTMVRVYLFPQEITSLYRVLNDAYFDKVPDLTALFQTIISIVSIGCVFYGVYQLFRDRKIKLIGIFYYPISIIVMYVLLKAFQSIFIPQMNFFFSSEDTPLFFKILYFANFLFVLLVIFYQYNVTGKDHNEGTPVSSNRRFINWIIDLIHLITFTNILVLGLLTIARTGGEIRFSDFHAYYIYAIFIFQYYFLHETIFLQTPGKMLNGCLLYTSPSPRDQRGSRMPSSA